MPECNVQITHSEMERLRRLVGQAFVWLLGCSVADWCLRSVQDDLTLGLALLVRIVRRHAYQ